MEDDNVGDFDGNSPLERQTAEAEATGVIYMIVNLADEKAYIGQTRVNPQKRWSQHKQDAKRLARGGRARCIHLDRAINAHGVEKFDFVVIEEDIPLANLNERECYHIANLNTMNSDVGYNCRSGGGQSTSLCDESRERMSASQRERNWTAYVRSRKHNDLLNGLPQYCRYRSIAGGSFAISGHPACKFRSFSVSAYGTIDAAKAALLETYSRLESGDLTVTRYEKDTDLPKGMSLYRGRYRVDKSVDGINYKKCFGSGTPGENRANAFRMLANIVNDEDLIIESIREASAAAMMAIINNDEYDDVDVKRESGSRDERWIAHRSAKAAAAVLHGIEYDDEPEPEPALPDGLYRVEGTDKIRVNTVIGGHTFDATVDYGSCEKNVGGAQRLLNMFIADYGQRPAAPKPPYRAVAKRDPVKKSGTPKSMTPPKATAPKPTKDEKRKEVLRKRQERKVAQEQKTADKQALKIQKNNNKLAAMAILNGIEYPDE